MPEHLLVMGGGYIGLEFAQMFRRFGSRVTVVQRNAQLLPLEDEDVAAEVRADPGAGRPRGRYRRRRPLRRAGGRRRAARAFGRRAAIACSRARTSCSRPAGCRTPTGSTAPPPVSRPTPRATFRVNDRLETTAAGVYALGDVKGGPQFTHISYDDFRIVRDNLLNGGSATTARPPRALHGVHRPSARPGRAEREGGSEAGARRTGRQDADELRRARARDGRVPRVHEGRWWTPVSAPDPRRRRAGDRGGRADVGVPAGDDGKSCRMTHCGTRSSPILCWRSPSTTCSPRSTPRSRGMTPMSLPPCPSLREPLAERCSRPGRAPCCWWRRSPTTSCAPAARPAHESRSSGTWDISPHFEELWLTRNLDGPIEFAEMPGTVQPVRASPQHAGQPPAARPARGAASDGRHPARVLARLAEADLDGGRTRCSATATSTTWCSSTSTSTTRRSSRRSSSSRARRTRRARGSTLPRRAGARARAAWPGSPADASRSAPTTGRPRTTTSGRGTRWTLAPFWIDVDPVTNGDYLEFHRGRRLPAPRVLVRRRLGAGSRSRASARPSTGSMARGRVAHPLHGPGAAGRSDASRSATSAGTRPRRSPALPGKRLPTEAEWEAAASWDPATGTAAYLSLGRGAADAGARQPGSARVRHRAGRAPTRGTSRRIGCYGMIGDVWEWTASDFAVSRVRALSLHRILRGVLRLRVQGAPRRLVGHAARAPSATPSATGTTPSAARSSAASGARAMP